ncbi:MAG TPA: metalloregulator ArsR/SmtB family transcription factor [Nevskiales bacterium]|nr:metalloregulator ArsR/SmtB family transcription factor [Nevskiales bacterium]
MSRFDLEYGTQLCRLLSDATRLRLLLLLESFELTVAELTELTGLAQSRVSTHLGKLRELNLVRDKRVGASAFYSANLRAQPAGTRQLLEGLLRSLDDHQIRHDRERAQQLVEARSHQQTWAESVAGRMERHYSPGRTWEATARALIGLTRLGRVLDIGSGDGVLAELLAGQAEHVDCLDASAAVVEAGQRRLARFSNVTFHRGDMHQLPFPARGFDQAFLMHVLTYTQQPQQVLAEAARVLKPGGQLVGATLKRHGHKETVATYNHVNLGYTEPRLRSLLQEAGFRVERCAVTSREPRPPYFEVITLLATRLG